MSFWKENPITQIDIFNLKSLPVKWKEDNIKNRDKAKALLPPSEKKICIRKYQI